MKHLGDITKINGAEIEAVDVITGGSPCQDLSIAGKRAGLAGARSGLFMEQIRIVKEMRAHDKANGRTGDMVRPRFMVWENVPGAFTSNDQTIFCMATQQGGAEVRSDDRAPTLTAAAGMSGNNQPVVALDMSHACDVIRDCGEIVPSLQARMGTGGNQVPLTYQAVTGTLSPGAHAGSYNGQDAYNDMLVVSSEISPTLRAKGNDPYREDMAAYIASVDCRNFCEGGETNGTLQAKESGGQSLNLQNTVRTGLIVRRLTPMECERLQGFPDHWTDIGEWRDSKGKLRKPSDSPRYKALGNSIALPFWDFLAKRISAQYLRPVTIGSLFDGIGGFPLVFERHNGNGTARWASEIEEFPIAVTKLRFGEDA